MNNSADYGYLQHGTGSDPFHTEKVTIRHLFADNWQCFYEGKWRKVYITISRLYIIFKGDKIAIKIEGV